MSKITFRADDDLIEHIEALDASKSEVMRDALRAYLAAGDAGRTERELPGDRVGNGRDSAAALDGLFASRLVGEMDGVDVTVRIEPSSPMGIGDVSGASLDDDVDTSDDQCSQCGEVIEPDHNFCPNCGQKPSRRLVCECGDELRAEWSFCPSCGRRTPAADVIDRS